MKNSFYLLLISLLQLFTYRNGYAQNGNTTDSFRLKGTIKADTGTVLLLPIGGKDFDPNKTNTYTARIKQGQFMFAGKLAYPTGFVLAFFPKYVSSPFIVEPGTQSISCQVDSAREIPKIDNPSMRELASAPVNFFASFNVSMKQRTRLLTYVKQHPDSYVGFWETVRQVNEGYASVLDSIYSSFSSSVQQTYAGNVLAQRLASSKATAIGQVFPPLDLVDIREKPVSMPLPRKAKYTLIDFWYARCTACLEEFPKLRKVFDTYQPKGFRIVGISIDKSVDAALWRSTIAKRGLIWDQYLDIAGKLTLHQLSIGYFPSNLLLDEQGVIIEKNISPSKLNDFLAKHL